MAEQNVNSMQTDRKVNPAIITGAILGIAGPLFALSPAILAWLISLGSPNNCGGGEGCGTVMWFMIATIPLGGIATLVGLVFTTIGLVKSFVKASKGIETDSGVRQVDIEKQARLLLLVAVPLLSWAWPVVGFAAINMIFGAAAMFLTVAWPLLIAACAIAGLILYVRAKTTRGVVWVIVSLVLSAGLTVLATSFLAASFNPPVA